MAKSLKTMPPAPGANHTTQVMEEVQCDLVTITSKNVFLSAMTMTLSIYILCVKDCFSKYCWLTPLESKEALSISRVIGKISDEHGAHIQKMEANLLILLYRMCVLDLMYG